MRPTASHRLRIHCLQQVWFEGPGFIETWAKQRGHQFAITCLHDNEEPPGPDGFDWLVVLGRPMSVSDESQYAWLLTEKQCICQAIKDQKVVLGICLRAQLIAEQLGAGVYGNDQPEIGWWPVYQTQVGKHHSILNGMPAVSSVFHWHQDTFNLPINAIHLLSSVCCTHQAFIVDDHTVGFQFHPEITGLQLRQMLAHGPARLSATAYQQSDAVMLAQRDIYVDNHRLFSRLLTNLEQLQVTRAKQRTNSSSDVQIG